MNQQTLDIPTLIDGYSLSCQTEGKSPKTIDWYTCFLQKFVLFLEDRQWPTDINKLSKDHLKIYIRFLQTEFRNPRNNELLSQATVQGYVRTLKAFLSWVIREEYITPTQFGHISIPKAATKIIETFSEEQVKTMLKLCLQSGRNGQRDATIIMLFLDSGIRVSELVNIDLADVDLTQGVIKIKIAKGGKERIVPIGSMVQKSLFKYIHTFRPKPLTPMINRLFISPRGLPLEINAIQILLRRLVTCPQ